MLLTKADFRRKINTGNKLKIDSKAESVSSFYNGHFSVFRRSEYMIIRILLCMGSVSLQLMTLSLERMMNFKEKDHMQKLI